MASITAAFRRYPWLTFAALLAAVKSIQFAIDSMPLFFFDSGSYILNALGLAFVTERSLVYSYLIRMVAVPLHSLRSIVVMQVVMGAVTAGLLALALFRYMHVRRGIAMLAGLVFACDPVQVVHERLLLTETSSLWAMALFLVTACAYLRKPELWRLAALSLVGVLLVSLRVVYVPLVFASAILLPLAVYFRPPAGEPWRRVRSLAAALAVSCISAFGLHAAYRHWIGWLGHREPAYHYATGFFMVSAVAPIITPADAPNPRIAQAIVAQNQSANPLWKRDNGSVQLFDPEGLVSRIKNLYPGNLRLSNDACQSLAMRAIRRDPLGYLNLAMLAYVDYWRRLPDLRWMLPWDNGSAVREVFPYEISIIRSAFNVDVSNDYLVQTPSRRYHIGARRWYRFLVASPFLGVIDLLLIFDAKRPGWLPRVCFVLWSWLLIAATCVGGPQAQFRYIHPISFTGLAAAGCLMDTLWCLAAGWLGRRKHEQEPAAEEVRAAASGTLA